MTISFYFALNLLRGGNKQLTKVKGCDLVKFNRVPKEFKKKESNPLSKLRRLCEKVI
jgi:hypothetical protein